MRYGPVSVDSTRNSGTGAKSGRWAVAALQPCRPEFSCRCAANASGSGIIDDHFHAFLRPWQPGIARTTQHWAFDFALADFAIVASDSLGKTSAAACR